MGTIMILCLKLTMSLLFAFKTAFMIKFCSYNDQSGMQHLTQYYLYYQCSFLGVLVVNVTWRGKTFVGTLLDATKNEWAPPR